MSVEYADIPRPELLEPGAPTAAWVLDVVTRHPELHRQREWGCEHNWADGRTYECGTVRCIGGWALWAHRRYAMVDGPFEIVAEAERLLFGNVWRTQADVAHLFYVATDEQSVKALTYLAYGTPIDWQACGAAAGALIGAGVMSAVDW